MSWDQLKNIPCYITGEKQNQMNVSLLKLSWKGEVLSIRKLFLTKLHLSWNTEFGVWLYVVYVTNLTSYKSKYQCIEGEPRRIHTAWKVENASVQCSNEMIWWCKKNLLPNWPWRVLSTTINIESASNVAVPALWFFTLKKIIHNNCE